MNIKVITTAQACGKYEGCNAPICPLDTVWSTRHYLDGDPVCPFLSEWAKPQTRDNLKGAIGVEMVSAIAQAYPKMLGAYGPHVKRLKRAAKTPSRMFRKEVANVY
jgi:hypothetical protein